MTNTEELELKRLCSILGQLAEKNPERPDREALKKASLALSVAYIHGHSHEIENLYSQLDSTLSDSAKDSLHVIGIKLRE